MADVSFFVNADVKGINKTLVHKTVKIPLMVHYLNHTIEIVSTGVCLRKLKYQHLKKLFILTNDYIRMGTAALSANFDKYCI